MKLTSETKLFLGIIAITIAIIVGAIALMSQPETSIARESLITADTPVRGSASASAFLVEFSDFQCPACKAAQPFVDQVVEEYKDSLVFAYRHYPLEQHPFSQQAAQAAEAAKAQGKFWEMYALLFANQEKFSDTEFTDLAKQLNLDMPQFEKAMKEKTYLPKVLADRDYGNTIGINATPTFFLNGKKLNLTTFADIKTAVAEAVKQ